MLVLVVMYFHGGLDLLPGLVAISCFGSEALSRRGVMQVNTSRTGQWKVEQQKQVQEFQVSGGRDSRPIGAYELAKAVEELGAGEILLNCIDCDGQGCGFDIDLIKMVSDAVTIPVIASSGAGAGAVEHFSEVFEKTNASAALAAGIFHRKEVPIQSVKEHLVDAGVEVRM